MQEEQQKSDLPAEESVGNEAPVQEEDSSFKDRGKTKKTCIFKKCFKNFKEGSWLRKIVTIVIILAILGGGYLLFKKIFKSEPKQVYEVAVMVRSQNNSDPEEDRKTSLKAGDALVVEELGHNWSQTEKVSYLILKMNLTEEEKEKLMSAEEQVIKFKDLPKEEQERIEEEKKRAEDAGEEYFEEPRVETLRMRAYRIDLRSKEFAGFKAIDLMNGQPFLEKVYDWGIVEKKKSVFKK